MRTQHRALNLSIESFLFKKKNECTSSYNERTNKKPRTKNNNFLYVLCINKTE